MNVLLIGANGGIGSAVLQFLLEENYVGNVTACSRQPIHIDHPKLTHAYVDLLDEGSIQSAVNQAANHGSLISC